MPLVYGVLSLNISRHMKDGAQSHNDISCAVVQPFPLQYKINIVVFFLPEEQLIF